MTEDGEFESMDEYRAFQRKLALEKGAESKRKKYGEKYPGLVVGDKTIGPPEYGEWRPISTLPQYGGRQKSGQTQSG